MHHIRFMGEADIRADGDPQNHWHFPILTTWGASE